MPAATLAMTPANEPATQPTSLACDWRLTDRHIVHSRVRCCCQEASDVISLTDYIDCTAFSHWYVSVCQTCTCNAVIVLGSSSVAARLCTCTFRTQLTISQPGMVKISMRVILLDLCLQSSVFILSCCFRDTGYLYVLSVMQVLRVFCCWCIFGFFMLNFHCLFTNIVLLYIMKLPHDIRILKLCGLRSICSDSSLHHSE